MNGVFLSFEGIDGSGKTSLANVLAVWLKNQGHKVTFVSVTGFEPIDQVTSYLIANKDIYDPYAHMFLSHANSRVLIKTIIQPCLENGEAVILDRYYHSAIAYSFPLGLPWDWMFQVSSVLTRPTKIVYCSVPVQTALSRKKAINEIEIGFDEQQERQAGFISYQTKVMHAYERMLDENPDDFIIIQNQDSIGSAQDHLIQAISPLFDGQNLR